MTASGNEDQKTKCGDYYPLRDPEVHELRQTDRLQRPSGSDFTPCKTTPDPLLQQEVNANIAAIEASTRQDGK